jgi:hypothetical protein
MKIKRKRKIIIIKVKKKRNFNKIINNKKIIY